MLGLQARHHWTWIPFLSELCCGNSWIRFGRVLLNNPVFYCKNICEQWSKCWFKTLLIHYMCTNTYLMLFMNKPCGFAILDFCSVALRSCIHSRVLSFFKAKCRLRGAFVSTFSRASIPPISIWIFQQDHKTLTRNYLNSSILHWEIKFLL